MDYPLLLISNINTQELKSIIESNIPNPEFYNNTASLVVDRGEAGVVFWKKIGITNRFLSLLKSYGITYTYYESKGVVSELSREELLDINLMTKAIEDLDTEEPTNEELDYSISPEILQATRFIEEVFQR